MELFLLAFGVLGWLALTLWLYSRLTHYESVNWFLSTELHLSEKVVGLLKKEISDMKAPKLPEIYTPEEFNAEQKRRWNERQNVERALKWDDAAKDGQS